MHEAKITGFPRCNMMCTDTVNALGIDTDNIQLYH
jgi:hypothetical protein